MNNLQAAKYVEALKDKNWTVRRDAAIALEKISPINVVFTRIVNDCSTVHGATGGARSPETDERVV